MKRWILTITIMATFGAMVIRCSSGTGIADNSGSASETVNARVIVDHQVVSVDLNSREPFDPELTLIPSLAAGPGTEALHTSFGDPDSTGRFRLEIAAKGYYSVLAVNRTDSRSLLIDSILVGEDNIDTLDDTLATPGTVYGTLKPPEARDLSDLAVAIQGSPFYGICDSAGTFSISDVPPGTHSLAVVSATAKLQRARPFLVTPITFDPEGPQDSVEIFLSQ